MDETVEQLEYRCVCGEVLSVASMETGCDCPACGRRCGATALRQALMTSAAYRQGVGGESTSAGRREPRQALAAGTQLEHFRIVDTLGQGGMGAVYRAIDESLQRYVALKVMEGAVGSTGDAEMERLLQEARAQARLNHPNVAQVYYVQHRPKDDKHVPFLAMELVGGETLEARLNRGPLPYREVMAVAVQMVRALEHAFTLDLVHRDVKPSNVMFAADGTVKLTDFGLAHSIGDAVEAEGKIVGTPAYMAPEVVSGSVGDFRSDVYAVGVTLFQMVFRRLPYTPAGEGVMAYFDAHLHAPVEYPEKWPADRPVGLRSLLGRLLAKDPNDRPQSYEELLRELEVLRPREVPVAGRFVRGLAWGLDLTLLLGINSVFVAPLQATDARSWVEQLPLLRLPMLGLALAAPGLAVAGQAYWRTTVGKRLLQLRVTDGHGGTPLRTVMAARMVAQAAPVIIINAVIFEQAAGVTPLPGLLALAGLLFLALDVGFGLFSRRRRSLHDRIFGTCVGLDVRAR